MKKLFLLAALALASCSSGVIYSPYMHAPLRPMQKDEGQAYIAGGLLPKAVQNDTKDLSGTAVGSWGAEGGLRYAFSKRLTLQGKLWGDFDTRGGASVSGIYRLDTAVQGFRWALVPQLGAVWESNSVEGRGASLSGLTWFPAYGMVQPYAALGAMIGTHSLEFSNEEWGWGLLGNLGAAFDLPANLTANIELAAIFQADQYNNRNAFILTPSLGLGWRFENK